MALTWRFADFGGTGVGNETSYTYSGVDIGAAAADRWVYAAFGPGTFTATGISSVTIGGVTATADPNNPASITGYMSGVFFFAANVPSGTTADVVVNYSGGGLYDNLVSVWTDNGEPTFNDAAIDTSISSNVLSVSVDVPADGKLLALARRLNMTAASWTGATESYDDATDDATAANAEGLSVETGRTVSVTFTNGLNFECLLGVTTFSTAGGGPASITGTLAATEGGADTASLAGDVIVRGALAASETGADTAAIAGNVPIAGALAAVESGADVAAMSGDVLVQGSLSATEAGQDLAAFIGTGSLPAIIGALAAEESGADTAALAGLVRIAGALAATEAGQDLAALAGFVPISGTLSASEAGSDTASFIGSGATPPVTGAMAAAEVGEDTASVAGGVLVRGDLVATEAGADTAAMSGRAIIAGIMAAAETGADVAFFSVYPAFGRWALPSESQTGGIVFTSANGGTLGRSVNGGNIIEA